MRCVLYTGKLGYQKMQTGLPELSILIGTARHVANIPEAIR